MLTPWRDQEPARSLLSTARPGRGEWFEPGRVKAGAQSDPAGVPLPTLQGTGSSRPAFSTSATDRRRASATREGCRS